MKKFLNLSLILMLSLTSCKRNNGDGINVTLHLNGGEINGKQELKLSLDEFKSLKKFPELYNKVFSSYYLDSYFTNRYTFDYEITTDIDLYAKYVDDIFTYELEEDKYSITKVKENIYSEITIPQFILNKEVNVLKEKAITNITVKGLYLPYIESIEKDAFYNSTITYLKIGDKIKDIEYGAFRNVKHLQNVIISDNPYYSAPNGVILEKLEGDDRIIIGSYGYDKTMFNEDEVSTVNIVGIAPYSFSNIYYYDETLSVKNKGFTFYVPSTMNKISDYAFNNCNVYCYNDEEKVKIQLGIYLFDNLKEVGKYAFSNSSLTLIKYEIKLVSEGKYAPTGKGVEVFKEGAFQNLDLKNLTIPKSLTTIEKDCFKGCDSLEVIYYEGNEEEFKKINIAEGNEALNNAQIYFYSEEYASGCWYYESSSTKVPFVGSTVLY